MTCLQLHMAKEVVQDYKLFLLFRLQRMEKERLKEASGDNLDKEEKKKKKK